LKLELNSFEDGDSKHQSKILEITAQKWDCYFWRKKPVNIESLKKGKKRLSQKIEGGG
jgi:hypothetical protein